MRASCWAVMTVLISFSTVARADYTVTIEPGPLGADGSGVVDFRIQSDNAGGDPLYFYQLQFQITLVSGSGTLGFTAPDTTALASDPSYVFSGNGDPIASVNTTAWANDTFKLGDIYTGSGSDATIGSTPKLLAEVSLVPGSGADAPAPGSVFAISLIPGSNTAANQSFGDTTFFFTSDFVTAIGFSSSSVNVEVPGIAAVPEPSGITQAAFGLSMLVLGCGLRYTWKARGFARPLAG